MSSVDLSNHPAVRAGLPAERVERLLGLERAVRKTTGQSTMISEAVSARFGLSSSDLECLDLVCAEGAMTAGQLAEASGLSSGAITGVVDRLERAGYVSRERDPDDRRRVVVQVQPLADEQLGPCYEALQQGFFEVCSDYDDEQLAMLEDFFQRCSRLGAQTLGQLTGEPEDDAADAVATRRERARAPDDRKA